MKLALASLMGGVLLTGFSCNHPATKSTKVKTTSQKELSENINHSVEGTDTVIFADAGFSEENQQDSILWDNFGPQESEPGPLVEFFLLKLIDSTAVFAIKRIDKDSENFFPYREVTDELNNQLSILPFIGIPVYDAHGKLLEVVESEPGKDNKYASKLIVTTPDGVTQEMLIVHVRSERILSLDQIPSRKYIQDFLRSCVKGVEIIYPSIEEPIDSTINIATNKHR